MVYINNIYTGLLVFPFIAAEVFIYTHVCDRSFHKVPQIVKRFVYFAMNSTPSVPGPQ